MPVIKDNISIGAVFDVIDIRDVSCGNKSAKACILSRTPFSVRCGDDIYPAFGYGTVPIMRNGHIITDEYDKFDMYNEARLYISPDKPDIDFTMELVESLKNVRDLDDAVVFTSEDSSEISLDDALADLNEFNVHVTNQPHVYMYDEFKDIKENISNLSLVERGFLKNPSVCPNDYNDYLMHCANQLRSGDFNFTGKIRTICELSMAYASCADLTQGCDEFKHDSHLHLAKYA